VLHVLHRGRATSLVRMGDVVRVEDVCGAVRVVVVVRVCALRVVQRGHVTLLIRAGRVALVGDGRGGLGGLVV
jgi:hypothetical protein